MIILRPCELLQTFTGRAPSGFLSLRRRCYLQPASPRAIFAAPDRKDPRSPGHTCSVPLTAKPSSVNFASDMHEASTNLKRDAGNTQNRLCNWVKLRGVKFLLVLCEYGTTDLCQGSAICNCLVHGLLSQSTHQWGVLP